MSMTKTPLRRNEALELCKLLASVLVVFIHVKFPGRVGSVTVSLARTAVPLFLAISGWFSFGTKPDRLLKRLGHILVLFAVAVAAAAVLGCPVAVCNGGTLAGFLRGFVPGTENLARMMLTHESSFPGTGYTWYLIAAAFCYLVLYVYVRFFGEEKADYRPLYFFAAVLLAANFLMGEMGRPLDVGVPYQLQRNGLFLGLPMFVLGLFLREYRERLLKNFALTDGKLVLLFLAGVALTLLQWKGIGTGELPPGAVVQVVALLLLLTGHPDLKCPWAGAAGAVSTVVYLIHFPLIGIYETFLLPLVPLGAGAESWLRPIFVAGISVLSGLIWVLIRSGVKKLQK